MGLNAFGTDNFLRGAIRTRLMHLRRDDIMIDAEGVDELSVPELQHACQSRGIRTTGVSPARLREELATWISLHLHNRVSGVLLILGRAFHFDKSPSEGEDGRTAVIRSLESVLSGLPDNLVSFPPKWRALLTYHTTQLNEAELEVDSEKASYKQKLEVLREQEELIEDEEEQEQKEEDARRAKREADELEARTAQSLLPDSEVNLLASNLRERRYY
jgi:LETM1 and EF-hand domain-containing protein 1, mitochondrial